MKEQIRKLYRKLRQHPLLAMAVVVVVTDIARFGADLYRYAHNPDVAQYRTLQSLVKDADANKSVEVRSASALIQELGSGAKVSILRLEREKAAIVARDGNRTLLAPEVPQSSLTFTIEPKLMAHQVDYRWVEAPAKPMPHLLAILLSPGIIDMLLLGGLLYFFMASTGMGFFKEKFTALEPEEIEGGLASLIGYEGIKAEARQLLQIITQKERYARYGIEGTFNILFSGKAGTGKSRFARYLAKELGLPIVSATGSLDEIYVGSGAKKVREIFSRAYAMAERSEHNACVLFIDEAQSLLRKRGQSREHGWEDDTRNELLAHLDGVEKSDKHHIIVIMASNFHSESLEMDEAMLRRFKKKIHFPDPNLHERKAILEHYLEKVEEKAHPIDTEYLAKNMAGLTPALIETVVQEASLEALRENTPVSTKTLLQALEKMTVGQSSRSLTQGKEALRRQIAIHELGHFLVEYHRAVLLHGSEMARVKESTRILKISSESLMQIGALGFAMREADELPLYSLEELEWQVRQLYGGLAAEQLVYGERGVTTGAGDDIAKATELLGEMISRNNLYGRAKLDYGLLGERSRKTEEIEEKAQQLFGESLEILQRYEGLLGYLTHVLLERWSLSKEELFDAIADYAEETVLSI